MTGFFSALRSIAIAALAVAMVVQFGPFCESAASAAPTATAGACADMMAHQSRDREPATDCAAICVAIPTPALAAYVPFEIAPIASLTGRLAVLSGIAAAPETPPPRMDRAFDPIQFIRRLS